MDKIDILGSMINTAGVEETAKAVESLIREDKCRYVCFSNVHTLVTGRRDKGYLDITNNAALAAADGMPLVWAGRLRGYKNMDRCCGTDFMDYFLGVSEEKGYTQFFYGASQATLKILEGKLKQRYPRLKVAGMYAPPYRALISEDEEIIKEINQLAPDIIWVGLGAPKQEIWMSKHAAKINHSIMLGVGAAFNFYAGTLKRAPAFMQKTGLEWLYRIIQEPGRLLGRYLTTNFLFLYYVVVDGIKKCISI